MNQLVDRLFYGESAIIKVSFLERADIWTTIAPPAGLSVWLRARLSILLLKRSRYTQINSAFRGTRKHYVISGVKELKG